MLILNLFARQLQKKCWGNDMGLEKVIPEGEKASMTAGALVTLHFA